MKAQLETVSIDCHKISVFLGLPFPLETLKKRPVLYPGGEEEKGQEGSRDGQSSWHRGAIELSRENHFCDLIPWNNSDSIC